MENETSLSERLGQEVFSVFTFSNLQLFLLIGSGLLAIALLVLALTRWGHARPIWKCVVLSVAAHVLFFTYAYGTHLIFDSPGSKGPSEPVFVSVVDDLDGSDDTTGQAADDSAAPKAWDEFASQPKLPKADSLARPDLDSSFVLQRSSLSEADGMEFERAAESELLVPQPTPLPLASAVPPLSAIAAIAPIERDPVEFKGEVEMAAAEPVPVLVEPTVIAELKTVPTAPDDPADANDAPLPEETKDKVAENVEIDEPAVETEVADSPPTPPLDESAAPSELDVVETKLAESTIADEEPEALNKPEEFPSDPESALATNSSEPTQPVVSESESRSDTTAAKTEIVRTPAATSNDPMPAVPRPKMAAVPIVSAAASKASPSAMAASVPKSRLADGKPMPKLYAARSATNRLAEAKKRGGSEATERAVEEALRWLSTQQQDDGRWNPRASGGGLEKRVFGHDRQGAGIRADNAITSLSILAFLAHGDTHLEGPYQETVQHGLEFLVRSQAANGDLAGEATFFARTYCHSMTLLALSEALALTGDQRLLPAVQSGVNFSVQTQNRSDGGWRYRVGDAGDMSQFGWKVLALHSAKLGGAHVPESTLANMKRFLAACAKGSDKGLAAYRPGEGVSTTMTAESLVCRHFLEGDVSNRVIRAASARVLRELPSRDKVNLYYWYYGTLAMYHAGGEEWDTWNRSLTTTLVNSQLANGRFAGSWEPNGLWAGYGGRVYSTAMATLCLEVYYRYLPTHDVANRGKRDRIR